MYHFATCPLSSVGFISTWIHVPGGVCAFHDETSSFHGNESVVGAEVQVPYSYVPEPLAPSPA